MQKNILILYTKKYLTICRNKHCNLFHVCAYSDMPTSSISMLYIQLITKCVMLFRFQVVFHPDEIR
jgi:hypothetical protein